MSKRRRPNNTSEAPSPPPVASPIPAPAQSPAPPPFPADPLLCPGCAFHFRAAPSPYVPSTFNGRGHSLCGLCADVVTLAPAPRCPVCQADIKARAVNVALGELGEAVWAAAQPAPAAPVPSCVICEAEAAGVEKGEAEVLPGHLKCSKCAKVLCADHADTHTRRLKGHVMEEGEGAARAPTRCLAHPDIPLTHFCVTDSAVICGVCAMEGHVGHEYVTLASGWCEARLRESAARVTPAANAKMRGMAVTFETIAALRSAKDAAIKQIEAETDALFVRLFAYSADMVKRVESVYGERMKALEAQAEELAVTSAQLRAVADVAAQALALPQPCGAVSVARGYSCVCAVGRLVGDCPVPAAASVLKMECDSLNAFATVAGDNFRNLATQLAHEEEDRARIEEEQHACPVLENSAILAWVDVTTVAAFRRVLTTDWLIAGMPTAPGAVFLTELLYRGSRDGMNATAFHAACDNKGPTLTLIRSSNGYTFGAYAGRSWSSPQPKPLSCGTRAFLFSVTGPYGSLTSFPSSNVVDGQMWCHAARGPCFGGIDGDGVVLRNSASAADAASGIFDETSQCCLSISFVDTLGKGDGTFTGAKTFTPEEIEVWSVKRQTAPVPASEALLAGDTRGFAMSRVLSYTRPHAVIAFLRELAVWLPRRAYSLLYRGSRDGMTAASFHRLCDGKGPTLVLVRCRLGWVFGGYTGASWMTPVAAECGKWGGKTITSLDAFVYSVTGPHTSVPVRFPASVTADKAPDALYCHVGYGPSFIGGLFVWAGVLSPTAAASRCFGEASFCRIGSGYDDVLGRGFASLTGAECFTPAEVEVYAVAGR